MRLNQVMPRLSGRIVLIENADPGYDWIFAHAIAGLVTKYGGANSHMAIRCAEFGIPAAIGCGEQRFDRLVKASRLRLDCAVGFISPLLPKLMVRFKAEGQPLDFEMVMDLPLGK